MQRIWVQVPASALLRLVFNFSSPRDHRFRRPQNCGCHHGDLVTLHLRREYVLIDHRARRRRCNQSTTAKNKTTITFWSNSARSTFYFLREHSAALLALLAIAFSSTDMSKSRDREFIGDPIARKKCVSKRKKNVDE